MWELDCEEMWALKNWCFWTVVLEKTLESHLDCKEIQPVHPKGDQSWVFIGRTDVEVKCKELTHLKRPWCWERLKVGGERDNRGWDGWMASLTLWTQVWVNSRGWLWTGRPGLMKSMVLQKSGTTEWLTRSYRIRLACNCFDQQSMPYMVLCQYQILRTVRLHLGLWRTGAAI